MGITIDVESDLNLVNPKPPHPLHAGHPYWVQHVVSVTPEIPSLAEVYAQLAAASVDMLVALSPLALWLPPPEARKPQPTMASRLSAVLSDVIDFTARRAGLASGQYRIIPLGNLQLMPPGKDGLRIAFQSLAAFDLYNKANWRRHLAAHDVAANSAHTTPPRVQPTPIRTGLVPVAPEPEQIETRLLRAVPAMPVPFRDSAAANDQYYAPKASAIPFTTAPA